MSFLENWLKPLLENYGLLIVFLTMVAESACILIPSEIVIPYGGFLAAQGHTHLWMVIAVAAAANVVGSTIAYAVGRYGGRALFLRYGRYVGAKAHHLEKAELWFERRGELTVFFTRMMPGVRTFISLPAGIVRMPVGKFLVYSFLGVVPWVAALAGLGYAAGKAAGEDPWGRLQEQFGRYNEIFYIVLAVLVVAFVGWQLWRWRRRRALKVDIMEGSTPEAPAVEESGEHLREE
jgi:membrane protein DedA with SNARE-associated domain